MNENPCVAEFLKNTQALSVVNTAWSTARDNCRGAAQKSKAPVKVDNSEIKKK